jgi:hypothetical protein
MTNWVYRVKDISPKSYIFWQICKIFRQNCISFANFVFKIKHISTEFVKDLFLKCAYFKNKSFTNSVEIKYAIFFLIAKIMTDN